MGPWGDANQAGFLSGNLPIIWKLEAKVGKGGAALGFQHPNHCKSLPSVSVSAHDSINNEAGTSPPSLDYLLHLKLKKKKSPHTQRKWKEGKDTMGKMLGNTFLSEFLAGSWLFCFGVQLCRHLKYHRVIGGKLLQGNLTKPVHLPILPMRKLRPGQVHRGNKKNQG